MTIWRILTAPAPGRPAEPPAPGILWLAKRQAAAVGYVLGLLVVMAGVCGCGFAHRGADGGFTVITLLKDLDVDGELEKADGTKLKAAVVSTSRAEQIGTAIGAGIRAAKP